MPDIIDFGVIGDINPYVNSAVTFHNGSLQVLSGLLKPINPGSNTIMRFNNALPVNASKATITTGVDSGSGQFDPVGPALVRADGSGYYVYVERSNFRLRHIDSSGNNSGDIVTGTATYSAGQEIELNYYEPTNTLTVSLDGTEIFVRADNTYVPTSSDPFFGGAFARRENINANGISRIEADTGDAPIIYNTMTDGDVALLIEHFVEGAMGGDTNQDGTPNTGHFVDAIATSNDVGRNVVDDWSLHSQYDLAAVAFSQMDYFETLPSLPNGYNKNTYLQTVAAYVTLYMDDYQRPTYTGVGYYKYTEGLREIYLRRLGDPSSTLPVVTLEDMRKMRDESTYSRISEFTNSAQYAWTKRTREVAYSLQSHVDGEKCGLPRNNDVLDALLDAAKSKLVSKQNQTGNVVGSYTPLDGSGTINYNDAPEAMKPFMMGLLINALTDFYDWEVLNGRGTEARVANIPTLIYNFLYWLCESAVVVSGGRPDDASLGQPMYMEDSVVNTRYNKTLSGFRYVDRNNPATGGGTEYASSLWFDLNALIAPSYYWIAKHYKGNDQVKSDYAFEKAERLLFSSMYKDTNRRLGFFQGGKQYNQQARWTIKAIRLRNQIKQTTSLAPVISVQPISRTVKDGDPVMFAVSGANLDIIQWYDASTNVMLTDVKANSQILTFNADAAQDGNQYYARIVGADGSVIQTNTITLTVDDITPSLSPSTPVSLPGSGNAVGTFASSETAVGYLLADVNNVNATVFNLDYRDSGSFVVADHINTDTLVVQPYNMSSARYTALDAQGTKPIVYVSAGEAADSANYIGDILPAWIIGRNPNWAASILDLRLPAVRSYILNSLMQPEITKGAKGVFLDTLDSYQLVLTTTADKQAYEAGLVQLIDDFKTANPTAEVWLNRGFEIFDAAKDDIDGVVFESYYRGYNGTNYTTVDSSERTFIDGKIAAVRTAKDVPVVALDYVQNPDDEFGVASQLTAAGFIPVVTSGNIDRVGQTAFIAKEGSDVVTFQQGTTYTDRYSISNVGAVTLNNGAAKSDGKIAVIAGNTQDVDVQILTITAGDDDPDTPDLGTDITGANPGQVVTRNVTVQGISPGITIPVVALGAATVNRNTAQLGDVVQVSITSGVFDATVTGGLRLGTNDDDTITITTRSKVYPSISGEPNSVSVTEGDAAAFNVVGTNFSTIQWYNASTNVPITNATSAGYAISATTLSDNGNTYYAIIRSIDGEQVQTQTVTLTVTASNSGGNSGNNGGSSGAVPAIFRYQYKGSPDNDNLVASETHTVSVQQPIIVLRHGAYYTDTLVVKKGATTLTPGVDYRLVSIDSYVTAKSGYEAAQAIEILQGAPGDFDITYHAVGGVEGKANQLLVDLREAINAISRSAVSWSAIAPTAPATFPPALHTHYPSQLRDLDLLAQEMRRLRLAMTSDRPLIDTGRDLSDRLDRLERLLSEQRNSINAMHYNMSSSDQILLIRDELKKYEESADITNAMLNGITEVLAEWDAADVSTVRGHVSYRGSDGSTHSEDVLIAHDGVQPFIVNYARLTTGGKLFTNAVTLAGGKLQFSMTPMMAGEVRVKWISIN